MSCDIIFVLGMHRSGTSLLTRGLQAIGIELGENLLPPVPGDNDKGYFEDRRLHDLDNELLEQLGRTWSSLHLPPEHIESSPELEEAGRAFLREKAGVGKPFALKDPRLCLLLPWWLDRCREVELQPAYVLALRHPLSVAKSVCKPGTARGDVAVVKALWLWYLHLTCAVRNSMGGLRVVVDYDLMMDAPVLQLQRIQSALHLPEVEPEQAFLDFFVDQSLRHSRYQVQSLMDHPDVSSGMIMLYKMLRDLAEDAIAPEASESEAVFAASLEHLADIGPLLAYISHQDELLRAVQWEMGKTTTEKAYLEDLAAQLAQVRERNEKEREIHLSKLASLKKELDVQKAELQNARNDALAVRAHLETVLNSRSWRLTAPLRNLGSLVKKP
ncbi:MAG: hypothetical protein ACNI3A_08335 [Desulfovibrio sp.]|uniref:sulfotransferase family protein n=1 Tax=Desulfovibrio sp. 7SRBS1 TaxID=3378064 RepID=UPI003B3ECDB4